MPAGRPKGSKNHQSKITALAAKYDLLPLDYMLQILNDDSIDQEGNPTRSDAERMEAAKSAAPYVHARLQAVTVEQKPYDGDINAISNEYLAGIIEGAGSSNRIAAEKGSSESD